MTQSWLWRAFFCLLLELGALALIWALAPVDSAAAGSLTFEGPPAVMAGGGQIGADPWAETLMPLAAAAYTTTTSITAVESQYTSGSYMVGFAVVVTVQVTKNASGGQIPTGRVNVTTGGGPTCSISLSSGSGTCGLFFTSAASGVTITATYDPDAGWEAGTAATHGPIDVQALNLNPNLSAGRYHTCYLDASGSFNCWGLSVSYPGGAQNNITTVSAGGYNTCGIKTDGDLQCWGENPTLLSVPATDAFNTGFLALSSGKDHACAIDTHNLLNCWGDLESLALTNVPTTTAVVAVSAGNSYDCAIRKDNNKLECWGDVISWSTPPTETVKAVAVGDRHACAIQSSNNQIICWGESGVTLPNFGSVQYVQIDSGSDYTCAIKSDGHLVCSGYGPNTPPVDAGGTYIGFSSGFLHTCALQAKSGTPPYYLACWGNNVEYQAPRIGMEPDAIQAYLPIGRPWSQAFAPFGGTSAHTISKSAGSYPSCTEAITDPLPANTMNCTPNGSDDTSYTFTLKAEENFGGSSLPLELKPFERSYSTMVQDPATSLSLSGPGSNVTAGSPVLIDITVSSPSSATPVLTGTVMITATTGITVEATCQAAVIGSGAPGHGTAQCALFFATQGTKTIQGAYLGSQFYLPDDADSITVEIDPVDIQPALSAGNQFSCSLDANGQIYCWGKDDSGQTSPPTSSVYYEVSASNSFACTRLVDSRIACWGWTGYGVSTPPSGYGYLNVTTGATHACALSYTGAVVCWGNPASGRITPPNGITFQQITAGKDHTCGLDYGNHARCWGINASNQTGIEFTHLSAGNNYTCGLKTDGGLFCWGSGISGTPTNTGYQALDAGYSHACAIASDDALVCWGDSTGGRTNAPAGGFSSLSAGSDHTCAIRTDDFMLCWGGNTFGQAPALSLSPDSLPTIDVDAAWNLDLDVDGGRLLAANYSFSSDPSTPLPGLGLDSNSGVLAGTPNQAGLFSYLVQAWERDLTPALVVERTYNQVVRSKVALSITSVTPSQPMVGEPVRVDFTVSETPGDFFIPEPTMTVTVSAASGPSCQFSISAGSGSCYLFFTSTGDKSLTASYAGDDYFMPGSTAAATLVSVTPFVQQPQVRTGLDRTFIHKADGSLRCVGANCTQLSQTTVYPVVGVGDALACAVRTDGQVLCKRNGLAAEIYPGQFRDLSVGKAHACAIDVHGDVSCWGENGAGQAGNHSGDFKAISAGDDFTCAVRNSDDGLQCWGNVPGGTPSGAYEAVSAGPDHACALATDNSLACWGDDSSGRSTPPAGDFQAVSVGSAHGCALGVDGILTCWGEDTYGRSTPPLGVFTTLDSYADHTCALSAGPKLTCWGKNDHGEAPSILLNTLTSSEIPALAYWEHIFLPAGGAKPYASSLVSGSLPPGTHMAVTLSPAGVVLYGTPSIPGEYPFTLDWQDAASVPLYAQQPYTLTVTGGDLGVKIFPAHPTTALYNNEFTFSYVVTNATALAVPDVLFSVELPEGLGGITYGGLPGCAHAGLSLACNLASLDAFTNLTFTVTGVVTAPLGTVMTTTAEIQPKLANWPEIQPSDNQDSASVQVGLQSAAFWAPFDADSPDARWTSGSVISTTTGVRYLGDFDNSDSLRLLLEDLPAHKRATISFDLYVIGPWQGNTLVGGQVGQWSFGLNGETPLLPTTFCNEAACSQAYPGVYPGDDYPWRSGAGGIDELGYIAADTRYHLSFSFLHEADFLDLLFSSLNLPPDAKWGLDNVQVILESSAFSGYLPVVQR